MSHFTSAQDIDNLQTLVQTAFAIKKDPYRDTLLGSNRSMCLLFLNPSLRTRLSTQKAALNLGLDTVVMDMGKEGWQLEFEDGVVMDGDKAEHVREAAAVIGQYYDIIGIRAFASLKDREEDYAEKVIQSFVKYAGVPIINLESPTRHPLQSLTDVITIEEFKKTRQPKVVLSWAPHPKALPQAVANSFLEWMQLTDYKVVITHPEGYELAEEFAGNFPVEYDQRKALESADFVYVKNWSSYRDYGKVNSMDLEWMLTHQKMKLTNDAKFMHCLPVRRNVIVEDAVIDSASSIVIPQAANREVAAQTVLEQILMDL